MSVSLDEIIRHAGYDIKNDINDARWLLAQKDEFEELLEIAEQMSDDYDEYEDYLDGLDDDHHQAELSFKDWRKENK